MSFEPNAGVMLALLAAVGAVWFLCQRLSRRRVVQAPSRDRHEAIVTYLRNHFDH